MNHRTRMQNRRLGDGGHDPLLHNAGMRYRKAVSRRYKDRIAAVRRTERALRSLGRAAGVAGSQMESFSSTVRAVGRIDTPAVSHPADPA